MTTCHRHREHVNETKRVAEATLAEAKAAMELAEATKAADRRARTPQLEIILDQPATAPTDRVIYNVRNNGPEDLDEVIIYRPRPPDQIIYKIAITGGGGWADDEIHLGPLALGQEKQFTLCCGSAEVLPEFRVRIECWSRTETWVMMKLLPSLRG